MGQIHEADRTEPQEVASAKYGVSTREKSYLVLTFVSMILLFCSVSEINPAVVDVGAAFGFASHLTPSYWIGYILLAGVSICASFDRELKRGITYVAILAAVGLFLFGIGVFAFENARIADAYWPTAEVHTLQDQGRLEITRPPVPAAYYSWPALHFFSASMLELPGISLGFIKFAPLVYALSLATLSYGMGSDASLHMVTILRGCRRCAPTPGCFYRCCIWL